MDKLLQYFADGEPKNIAKVRSDLAAFFAQHGIDLPTSLQRLAQQGIQIEQTPDTLRLIPQLSQLNLPEISTALSPYRVHYQPVISSTNAFIADRLPQLNKGDLCLAECQSAGRGRRGRHWLSPFGGQIIVSFYWTLPPSIPLDGLSLVIGLAIAKTLNLKVKWPNDVLLFGRKLAGILIEIANHKNGLQNLIIGIGINISLPAGADINQPYAQLTEIQPHADRNRLIPQLIHQIYDHLDYFERHGIDDFLQQEWQRFDEYFGANVNVIKENNIITGIAQGIDSQGHLQLLTAHGEIQTFNAGEVSLRKK